MYPISTCLVLALTILLSGAVFSGIELRRGKVKPLEVKTPEVPRPIMREQITSSAVGTVSYAPTVTRDFVFKTSGVGRQEVDVGFPIEALRVFQPEQVRLLPVAGSPRTFELSGERLTLSIEGTKVVLNDNGANIPVEFLAYSRGTTGRPQERIPKPPVKGTSLTVTGYAPTLSMSRKRASNYGAVYLETTTTGGGSQELPLSEDCRPKRIVFDPSGKFLSEDDLQADVTIENGICTVRRFTENGIVIDDHGSTLGLKIYVLDSTPLRPTEAQASGPTKES